MVRAVRYGKLLGGHLAQLLCYLGRIGADDAVKNAASITTPANSGASTKSTLRSMRAVSFCDKPIPACLSERQTPVHWKSRASAETSFVGFDGARSGATGRTASVLSRQPPPRSAASFHSIVPAIHGMYYTDLYRGDFGSVVHRPEPMVEFLPAGNADDLMHVKY